MRLILLYIRSKKTSFYLKCCVLSFSQLQTTNYSDLTEGGNGMMLKSISLRERITTFANRGFLLINMGRNVSSGNNW